MLKPLTRAPADVAIDLGTSSTRIFVRGKGLVADEPTVVAIHRGAKGREVVAVGDEAKRMLGRTPPGTEVIRPIRGGLVDDFQATEQLLRALMRKAGATSLLRPRLLVCIPSDTTEVERRAVQESARAAGGREVFLVSTGMAAAIGAELPVEEPVGSVIVDIGGGRTDIAVTSLGGAVVGISEQIAGDDMDRAVSRWLAEVHKLQVGERTAELLKIRVGSAMRGSRGATMRTRGRDIDTGTPKEIDIGSDALAEGLLPVIERIRDVVLAALGKIPPELAADIVDRGILLCGGASQLDGLDGVLREATGLPVLHAEGPTTCVARGAGRLLEEAGLFARVARPA